MHDAAITPPVRAPSKRDEAQGYRAPAVPSGREGSAAAGASAYTAIAR